MSRIIHIALGQLGPVSRDESREHVVRRLCALVTQAYASRAGLIVFPELALTTFFPRWYMQDDRQVDAFCETEMPNVATRPLFDLARRLRVAFYLGYAEAALEGVNKVRYNTSILVDQDGRIVGKYRKIHLPGHHEYEPWRKFQHLDCIVRDSVGDWVGRIRACIDPVPALRLSSTASQSAITVKSLVPIPTSVAS